jgi:hypothetical protein
MGWVCAVKRALAAHKPASASASSASASITPAPAPAPAASAGAGAGAAAGDAKREMALELYRSVIRHALDDGKVTPKDEKVSDDVVWCGVVLCCVVMCCVGKKSLMHAVCCVLCVTDVRGYEESVSDQRRTAQSGVESAASVRGALGRTQKERSVRGMCVCVARCVLRCCCCCWLLR